MLHFGFSQCTTLVKLVAVSAAGLMVALSVPSSILILYAAESDTAWDDEYTSTLDYQFLSVPADRAISYNITTETVTFEKNADISVPLASITKLAVAHHLMLEEKNNGFISTNFGQVAVKDAIAYGLPVSSNHLFQSLLPRLQNSDRALSEIFTALGVTSELKAAGIEKIVLLNLSGLDITPNIAGAYGSARSVALLAASTVERTPELARLSVEKNPQLYTLSGQTYQGTNTNTLLANRSDVVLSKTGFTDLAGGNLVVVTQEANGDYVAHVALGSTREGRFAAIDALINGYRTYHR